MMRKVKSFLRGFRIVRSQGGMTLAEVFIALLISGLVLLGTFEVMRHMVVTSRADRNQANAMCQVQYVGFWVSEDVVQARPDGVRGAYDDGENLPFPLTIYWKEWDGDVNEVIYSLEETDEYIPNEVNKLSKLTRQHKYTPKGGSLIDEGTVVVGEFLDPTGTNCKWATGDVEGGNVTDVLKLSVSANVNGQVASRTYEINPRSK